MSKILVLTYGKIEGIPEGRHERGNLAIYSGGLICEKYAGPLFQSSAIGEQEDLQIKKIKIAFMQDLQNVELAFVYVGAGALEGAKELFDIMRKAGIKINAVVCTCQNKEKRHFLRLLANEWIISRECGGEKTLEDIVQANC